MERNSNIKEGDFVSILREYPTLSFSKIYKVMISDLVNNVIGVYNDEGQFISCDIDLFSKVVWTTSEKIFQICDSICSLLQYKNEKYGDSALNPINIFSKQDDLNSLLIRMDDKLSRVKNSTELRKNDCGDLLGYLILICASKDWLNFDEFKD